MQHEVTTPQDLLNKDGKVAEPGWAKRLIWRYNRGNIKAPWFRRKEWDYYLITNKEYGVAFTISDLGYAGLVSVSLLDFVHGTEHTESVIDPLPRGAKYGLGTDSAAGYAHVKTKRVHMRFDTENGKRILECKFLKFYENKTLSAKFYLYEPEMDTICIATPWKEKETAFYYNQKKNCMPAKGKVMLGDEEYRFYPDASFGVLDWGRGVWTYDNTWYWGTGSGLLDGTPFGINLGYGFSDRTSASENVVFYNYKAYKLNEVEFLIPRDRDGHNAYMETWKITSDDHAFEGSFAPILDRNAKIDGKIIVSNQHQVFGRLTADITLDGTKKLHVEDFLCAFEMVHNRY